MHDRFEQSLRELMNDSPAGRDERAALGKVLKTANRQIGAGKLFSLTGHWFEAIMIALNTTARRSRATKSIRDEQDKAP
ncbi:CrfX protein [Pseudomonas matsuisoli]|uniref:CrfX protein n=1 Tax=Pseudomonas matsuisoli TaxID=1515666 RepID=A0A917Q1X5_9PSED|nr:crfX protein [Pseudomonas matsuisoli]